MVIVKNLKLKLDHLDEDLESKICKVLKIKKKELKSYEILKKAIDSRKKSNVHFVYNLKVDVTCESKVLKIKGIDVYIPYHYETLKVVKEKFNRPVIVGSGPAGLLCGIILAEAGANPLIIEQGKDVDSRKKDIDLFWETGNLDVKSNVQFGAGGAGTFSDGKLTTGVNNPLKHKLIEELIAAGAPEEIRYSSKPHLGTDILIYVVRNICKKIESLGGEFLFETTFVDYKEVDNKLESIYVCDSDGKIHNLVCNYLILAIGHSSRETFFMLQRNGIKMLPKPFAVGFRIEHLQKEVNSCQYGDFADELESASYKINVKLGKRSLYTFCMCPGGVVVGAASEKGRVVTNGMSYYLRDMINSNSALLVNIGPDDFDGDKDPLNGINFQRSLEEIAFKMGGSNYYAPVQKVGDFLNGKVSDSFEKVKPSYLPGTKSVDLNKEFPGFLVDSLKEGIITMRDKVSFLKDDEAVLTAVESRSSSPVTIVRNDVFMSNIYGIIPCGEGCGYAGGIVSAAVDGIKCAEVVINLINEENLLN